MAYKYSTSCSIPNPYTTFLTRTTLWLHSSSYELIGELTTFYVAGFGKAKMKPTSNTQMTLLTRKSLTSIDTLKNTLFGTQSFPTSQKHLSCFNILYPNLKKKTHIAAYGNSMANQSIT